MTLRNDNIAVIQNKTACLMNKDLYLTFARYALRTAWLLNWSIRDSAFPLVLASRRTPEVNRLREVSVTREKPEL